MKITVVGAGYVGLVTSAGLAATGHDVTCVDRDEAKIGSIQAGQVPFHEPGLEELLKQQRAAGRLQASTDLAEGLADSAVSIIAVGTPSNDQGIDLSHIREAARGVGRLLRSLGHYHVVTVKSTVVPTTTDTVVRRELEDASGLISGRDFGLAMNPEFLSEGQAVADFLRPDRIVIGASTPRAGSILEDMYAAFECPIVRTTPRNAEMIKYAANALQATLISFSNEIAGICEAIPELDESVVMRGVHLDRAWATRTPDGAIQLSGATGFLRSGIGFGGSCFPKDLKALEAFAAKEGASAPLLGSVLRINQERAGRIAQLLASHVGPLREKRIAVLGVAFKPGTDDTRESPGMRVAQALRLRGADVVVHDPMVKADALRDWLGSDIAYASDIADAATGADAVVIATGWDDYRKVDWKEIASRMRRPVIFDGRQVVAADRVGKHATLLAPGRKPPARGILRRSAIVMRPGRSAALVAGEYDT